MRIKSGSIYPEIEYNDSTTKLFLTFTSPTHVHVCTVGGFDKTGFFYLSIKEFINYYISFDMFFVDGQWTASVRSSSGVERADAYNGGRLITEAKKRKVTEKVETLLLEYSKNNEFIAAHEKAIIIKEESDTAAILIRIEQIDEKIKELEDERIELRAKYQERTRQ